MTSSLANNVWKLTASRALMTAYLHLPVIVLFWQANGLSLTEIMLLQSAFAVTSVALEVPCGIFADLYGRKTAIVLAAAFNVGALALYSAAASFSGFLLGEMAMATFVSLVSGADSALLFDSLRALGRQDEFARRYGNLIFIQNAVLALANVAGGLLGEVDLRYTLYAGLPLTTAALLLALTLAEPPAVRHGTGKTTLLSQMREIGGVVRGDHALAWLLLYAGIVLAFNQAGLWLYQPYFTISGVGVAWFGAIFASFQIVAGLASKYGYVLNHRIGADNGIYLLIFVSAIASLLLGNVVFLFSFAFIYLHQVVRGLYKVSFSTVVNERIDSHVRASVLSVQNLTGRILIAAIGPLFGWYADAYTVEQTFTLIGVLGIALGLPAVLVLRAALRQPAPAGVAGGAPAPGRSPS